MKKVLSTVVIVAMLLSMVTIGALANENLPEAKLEKLAPIVLTEADEYAVYDGSLHYGVGNKPLNVVVKFSAVDTAETVQNSPYKDWYTDFYITFDGLKNGSLVADGCYLAGNYGTFGWIVIPTDGLEIKEGEVYPVVSSYDAHLTYTEICTNVKEMICAIYIKPEIIEANPNMTVTLNLGIKNGDDGEVKYVNSSIYDTDILAGYVAKIGEKKYTSLQKALNDTVKAGRNVTVDILADIDLANVDWSPVSVNGAVKPAAHLVTVNGNNHTITNLNNMLFSGTWAGKSGLIINDLTIADSNIVNDKDDTAGTVGVGAFIGYPQASETITLNNCHLINSTVEGGHWTGGLIGMAGGYNGNDGPVFMNLTITGCSVKDSVITGKGSVGGLMGHASCAAWTKVVVENTVVSENTVTSTGSSNEKAGAVFGTVGAAGQETTADGETKVGGQFVAATVENNTVTSNGTTITTIYGRQGTNTGKLELTGGSYDHKPISGEESWTGIKAGFALEENADGTYSVEREYTITLSTDGGKYSDGTAAIAFNAFFKQWESQTVDAFGMYIYKQSDNFGAKVIINTNAGNTLTEARGLFNAVVTDIPAEANNDYIVCLPYVMVGGNTITGEAKAVTASQFSKILAD